MELPATWVREGPLSLGIGNGKLGWEREQGGLEKLGVGEGKGKGVLTLPGK